MSSCAKQTALVLGGGTQMGIGRACADRFLTAGYEVLIWDRGFEEPLPGDAVCDEVDITDWHGVANRARGLPPLSAAVNAVAIGAVGSVVETSREEWDHVVDVNLNGAFYAAHWLYEALRAGRGTLINLSSIFATSVFPHRAVYAATKAAILALSQCLAIEWAPDGIRVLAVSPGWTRTGVQLAAIESGAKDVDRMLERTAQRRMLETAEVAAVVFRLAQPEFGAVTGSNVFVDGGFHALGGGFWGLDRQATEEG